MSLKYFAPLVLSVALFVPGLAQAAPPKPAATPAHATASQAASLQGKVQGLNATSLTLEVGKDKKVLPLFKKVTYLPNQAAIKPGVKVKVETNAAGAVTSITQVK